MKTLISTVVFALGVGVVLMGHPSTLARGALSEVEGQVRGAQQPAAPSARASAPIDLTGYWVSVVNKDWRWRMVTPPKGDFVSIPVTDAARKVGDAWDPAKDEAAGEQCRAYGAAGLMRIPGRLRISWQDENTLKVETDAGMQTRLIQFVARPSSGGRPTWQGDSVAQWHGVTTRQAAVVGAAVREGGPSEGGQTYGSLEVITRNMRPGYLRRNGVPYSANTVMTEYWDLHREPDTDWLVISTTIVDPTYLNQPYLTSPAFKREPDGSKWDPSPCSATW